MNRGRAASVLHRLLNRSRETGENYNLLLNRYAVDPSSLLIASIRDAQAYGGLRGTVRAEIGRARLPVQIDIGFGDAVSPAPEWTTYPALLDGMAAPRLRSYPVYTVVSEKFEAMVQLGLNNSRMKDFFDLLVVAERSALQGVLLVEALRATFERRGTALPAGTPVPLSKAFAEDPAKLRQWQAFLSKSGLPARELPGVIELLAAWLRPALQAARRGEPFNVKWDPATRGWA